MRQGRILAGYSLTSPKSSIASCTSSTAVLAQVRIQPEDFSVSVRATSSNNFLVFPEIISDLQVPQRPVLQLCSSIKLERNAASSNVSSDAASNCLPREMLITGKKSTPRFVRHR